MGQDQQPKIDWNHLDHFEHETQANRVSIAYWREKDPVYLDNLVREFRTILDKLPSPVPANEDRKKYFTDNYDKLQEQTNLYGWFQLEMVVSAYDERPKPTMRELLDQLPKLTY